MIKGFIRERDTETTTYRGYKMTVESKRVLVHAQDGKTTAEFAKMVTARQFIRYLRGGRR